MWFKFNLIIKWLVLPGIISLFISGCRDNDRIIGIKIYEYTGNYNELADKWNDMGINTAFTSVSLASDPEFRSAMKKNNIPVFIICPVFYNPIALKADSNLSAITQKGNIARDDWVEFICPSRKGYRKQISDSIAGVVKRLDPDGISIDFIRQFVFWEMIYADRSGGSIDKACFCDSCLNNFSAAIDLDLPDSCITTSQLAEYILNHHSESWNNFRTDLIAETVKQIVEGVKREKPGILINIHVVPWRADDFDGAIIDVAAQDLKKIAPFTDFISPMCYSQMLKREPSWISSIVSEMDTRATGIILPSIQVYEYYVNTPFDAMDFRQCLEEALKPPSKGVVFWSWPLFEKDPERMKVVRDILNSGRLQ